MTLLLLATLAGLAATETCPPPALTPSESAADNFYLFQPPFLANEDPLNDPYPDEADRKTVMDGLLRKRIAEMRADVPVAGHAAADGSATTWIYSYATGWLLVPSSLHIRKSAVGVDGSWLLEMTDAAGSVRLQATSTGSCVGCAMSEAALWFPEQVEAARNSDFLFCERFAPAPEIVSRTATRVRWQRQEADGGRLLQGVVVDRTGDDEGLQTLSVSGLEADVAAAVLDGFGL